MDKVKRAAVMDFDDQCRMVLEQISGGPGLGLTAVWLMCNPSRANAEIGDPTAGRVVGHSARHGCERPLIGNVYPYRTPYPADLWEARGDGTITAEMMEANYEALTMIGAQADILIFAYGAGPAKEDPSELARAIKAITLATNATPMCLGVTKDGQPLHPLARGKNAIPANVTLKPYLTT